MPSGVLLIKWHLSSGNLSTLGFILQMILSSVQKALMKPNIILDTKLQAVAIKRIKCGDEILLDYLYNNDEEVVPTEAATL